MPLTLTDAQVQKLIGVLGEASETLDHVASLYRSDGEERERCASDSQEISECLAILQAVS